MLQGIDALVEEGAADPERLTIGGYSFGGYLTNWLITQTTRFKAAVAGAGDAQFVVNWGNNKFPLPYAYSLGGLPWENQARIPPLFKPLSGRSAKSSHPLTSSLAPTTLPSTSGEAYLLERALTARGIPNTLLIFPGEGHLLDANPWHGKIKVREELKWLEKYGGKSPHVTHRPVSNRMLGLVRSKPLDGNSAGKSRLPVKSSGRVTGNPSIIWVREGLPTNHPESSHQRGTCRVGYNHAHTWTLLRYKSWAIRIHRRWDQAAWARCIAPATRG